MNLWAKRTGQLLVAFLFLMSCEDDSFLLGFKNKNKQFEVRYHEFKFPGDTTSVMLVDSLTTDHYNLSSGTYRLLAGQYDDPYFGVVRSEFYTQFLPVSGAQITEGTQDGASIAIQLELDFYYYGGVEEDHLEKFTVYELTDSINTSKRYFYNSSLGYNPAAPLGEISINVDNFALTEINNPDTLLIEGELNTSHGELFAGRLKGYSVNNDSLGNRAFREAFKGLVVIPSADNKYILGTDPLSIVSRMTLHYKATNGDDREKIFWFPPTGITSSFNKISTQRTGDLAGITAPYEPITPSNGLRYIQSGSPVVTFLDLSQYYDFIRGNGSDGNDSLQKIMINSTELSIGLAETPPKNLPPPSSLALRVLKKVDEKYFFQNKFVGTDSVEMIGFRVVRDGEYYVTSGDSGGYMELTYNASQKRYVGRPTIFLQNLFDKKEVDRDVAYFAVIPTGPNPGKSVNRVIINTNDIKLGIYYTKVNISNLE